MRNILVVGAAITLLAACATSAPPPLPPDGPIVYTCADGTQLQVDFSGQEARVAVVGGRSFVLPNRGDATAPYYTNGRYGLRGRGAAATWQTGTGAPVACRGG